MVAPNLDICVYTSYMEGSLNERSRGVFTAYATNDKALSLPPVKTSQVFKTCKVLLPGVF